MQKQKTDAYLTNDMYVVKEDNEIRTVVDLFTGKVYYSIIDIIYLMRDDETRLYTRDYWAVMKHRLLNKSYYNRQLEFKKFKVTSLDGKKRGTDFLDAANVLKVLRFGSFIHGSNDDENESLIEFLDDFSKRERKDYGEEEYLEKRKHQYHNSYSSYWL